MIGRLGSVNNKILCPFWTRGDIGLQASPLVLDGVLVHGGTLLAVRLLWQPLCFYFRRLQACPRVWIVLAFEDTSSYSDGYVSLTIYRPLLLLNHELTAKLGCLWGHVHWFKIWVSLVWCPVNDKRGMGYSVWSKFDTELIRMNLHLCACVGNIDDCYSGVNSCLFCHQDGFFFIGGWWMECAWCEMIRWRMWQCVILWSCIMLKACPLHQDCFCLIWLCHVLCWG